MKIPFIFIVIVSCFAVCRNENVPEVNSTGLSVVANTSVIPDALDVVKRAKGAEAIIKKLLKDGVKRVLPYLMQYNSPNGTSSKCTRSLLKFISSLTSAKLWAVRMLDSTSKPPAGVFEGTFSDFGAFDQCLSITVPFKNGTEEFKGSYCAIEARPYMPPIPRLFTMATKKKSGPLQSIADELLTAGSAFYYLKIRFGVCVPSACTEDDLRAIAKPVGEMIKMNVVVPRCYVKEPVRFNAVQTAVIFVLFLLTLIASAGTCIEIMGRSRKLFKGRYSSAVNVLLCFSLANNYKRLMSSSKGQAQLNALHGIRALSIAWVILGHTYVWMNFQLLRHPEDVQNWFSSPEMEVILNGWLSVEPFFLLSGLLTCYGCIQIMEKTKGKLNVPIFILRRYIRLTPSMMMVIGVFFLLPLISSGPFWYEIMDNELKSCQNNWWMSLLYITNWTSMKSICIHSNWYLSADLQLHIVSLFVLYALYRSQKIGYIVMGISTLVASAIVGFITYSWDLPPFIQISSANEKKITDTVDLIHIRTFSHFGSYCIGMLTGYLILKYRHVKLSKRTCSMFWFASFAVSVASIYGSHPWNIGKDQGRFLTSVYAALHRTTFSAGVAWVAYACVSGHAGIINDFLSSPIFAPFSRLTFTAYLVQSLVIWVRRASSRERMHVNNYNVVYDYFGHIIVVIMCSVPLHLLVEAPISNLDRLIFSRAAAKLTDSSSSSSDNDAKEANVKNDSSLTNGDVSEVSNVELRSVKTIHTEDESKVPVTNGMSH